jgi:hypothetical protein
MRAVQKFEDQGSIRVNAMSRLALVSTNPSSDFPIGAQVAHDLRNLLAAVGLHLETLQRLSGPNGARAADIAHALLARGGALCNSALDRSTNADSRAHRRGVDILLTARKIADLLASDTPSEFFFDIAHNSNAYVGRQSRWRTTTKQPL